MRFRITTLDVGHAVAIHEMDALDEADAQRQALARGLRVLAINASRLRVSRRARLSLVSFSNELVALLEAGLTLVEAIDALTEKERDEAVRDLLEGLRRRLYEGQSLSVALGEYPSSFPTLYVATVRASERTGAIAEALRRFVAYQQQIDLLKKRLINASIYPAVLLAAGSLVVLFLVTYVVPRFSGIYEDIGGELPLASKMLMRWGRLLDAHGAAVLAGFLAFAVLAGYGVSRPGVRGAVGRLWLRIPAVVLEIRTLRGQLIPTRAGQNPWFDDPSSFLLQLDEAEIALTPASMSAILNQYVFTGPKAPIKNVEIEIAGNRLRQAATLNKKIPVRATLEGELSVTPDGKIKLHPTSIELVEQT